MLKEMSAGISLQPTIIVANIRGFEVLKINEIIMCKADGYVTMFNLTSSRKVNSSKNLKHYESQLSELGFIRVHNSYLININHVISYSKQGEIMLSENNVAFLGDRYRNSFLTAFDKR
jgi:two-component system LytT family response regulator